MPSSDSSDMRAPGPDAGKGGKYLILPPDYKGEMPKDKRRVGELATSLASIRVANHDTRQQSRSLQVVRLFQGNELGRFGIGADGKPDAATKMFKETVSMAPRRNPSINEAGLAASIGIIFFVDIVPAFF